MCTINATFVSGHNAPVMFQLPTLGVAPFVPPIDPSNAGDTQNFDDTYLEMEPVIADEADDSNSANDQTDNERTDGEDSVATPSQSRSPSVHPEDDSVDVFDGYCWHWSQGR